MCLLIPPVKEVDPNARRTPLIEVAPLAAASSSSLLYFTLDISPGDRN